MHILQLDHIAQGDVDLFCFRITQEDGFDDHVAIDLLFLRGGGVDQQRIAVQHLLPQVIRQQQHVDSIFRSGAFGYQAAGSAGGNIFVKNDIDPGHLADGVKDGHQAVLAKIKRYRFLQFPVQTLLRLVDPRHLTHQVIAQRARLGPVGIFFQYLLDFVQRACRVAGAVSHRLLIQCVQRSTGIEFA